MEVSGALIDSLRGDEALSASEMVCSSHFKLGKRVRAKESSRIDWTLRLSQSGPMPKRSATETLSKNAEFWPTSV